METVLLSTHNICFGWGIRKFTLSHTLSSRGLTYSLYFLAVTPMATNNIWFSLPVTAADEEKHELTVADIQFFNTDGIIKPSRLLKHNKIKHCFIQNFFVQNPNEGGTHVKASSHIDENDPTSSCAYWRIGLKPNSLSFVKASSHISESVRRSLANRVNLWIQANFERKFRKFVT